ncbi:hypothetical protein WMF26_36755 [Sorangium sp. So ce185]
MTSHSVDANHAALLLKLLTANLMRRDMRPAVAGQRVRKTLRAGG